MTRLPQLHQELVLAAQREEEQVQSLGLLLRLAARGSKRRIAASSRLRGGRRERPSLLYALPGQLRRPRLVVVLLTGVLASTTIALAATGVVITGSAVPGAKLSPRAGVGVPVTGGSRLLPLRVSDPRHGLPWGIRVVHTTRGEICVQVGRVKGGQIGVLGVDGAFHDDGELHPLPADALPNDRSGILDANADTSCTISGQSLAVAKLGLPASAYGAIPRGAAAIRRAKALPRNDLRDVYFGLLGPSAVSVSYQDRGQERTQRVVPKLGAYLIVQQGSDSRTEGSGGEMASQGLLYPGPSEPLSKFTYRVDGKLCEVGLRWVKGREAVWRSEGTAPDVAHPCPAGSHAPTERGFPGVRRLHVPLRPRLLVRRGVVTGLTVSFGAPYAVQGAASGYSVMLPQVSCHHAREPEGLGGTGFQLDRDVRKGSVISAFIAYPFRVSHICGKKEVEVNILYRRVDQRGVTIVGKVTVKQPPHVGNGAKPKGSGSQLVEPDRAPSPPAPAGASARTG